MDQWFDFVNLISQQGFFSYFRVDTRGVLLEKIQKQITFLKRFHVMLPRVIL